MDPSSPPAQAARPPARLFERLGPFAYLGVLFLCALGVLGLARVLLAAAFHERVVLEPRWLHLFPLALRLDLSTVGYAMVVPVLGLLLLPRAALRRVRAVFAGYFALVLTLLLAMEAVTFDFLEQYDVRPDRLFVEYLGSREVLETLWVHYRMHLLLVALALVACLVATWRLGSAQVRAAEAWPWRRRALALVIVAPALFLGIRGTLRHRPINAAMVAFSGQNLVNQLALNSTYTAARAWYDARHERSAADLYGRMPEDEVLARVSKYVPLAAEDRVESP